MVVQCPTCQSKFRIADEKVTERGVRVRCTSCKNVFQVRKPGASADPSAAPGPGSTMDLSSLGAAAIAKAAGAATKPAAASRPGTGPVKPSTGPVKPSTGPVKPSTGPVKPSTGPVKPSTGPVKPSTGPVKPSTGPVKPSTGPVKAAKPSTGPVRVSTKHGEGNGAKRLDVDDLFGMAELTGDSPLDPPAPATSAPSAQAKPAETALSGLDDLDLEIETRPPSKPQPLGETPLPSLDSPSPAPRGEAAQLPAKPATEIPLDDSFGTGAAPAETRAPSSGLELDTKPAKAPEPLPPPKPEPARKPITKPQQQAKPKEPEIAPAKAVISSALTGLLGAALAIIVVISSALSDDRGASWLGFGPSTDVVATGVVSGIYDTAGGKPVFYVRGRVQNRSDKVRGPVRVTAELVGGDGPLKAETIAGVEPTPEDVWSVRSPADAEKLSTSLISGRVDRKLEPGASLPFFALIPEPPADLQGRRLRIQVESVEAWTPRAAKTARDR